jgi:cell wall-associated NlpC family hydrolase
MVCIGLLSSCMRAENNVQQLREQTAPGEQVTDDRISDTALLEGDAELKVGDLGVERQLLPARVREQQMTVKSVKGQLLDPNGFPLIRRTPSPGIVPLKSSFAENVIASAKSYLGTPYVYGSDRNEPSTFDCSDFTRWVFLYALGMDLPWDSRAQAAYVKAFAKRQYTKLGQARRGDLLFFTTFRGNSANDYKGLKPSDKPITHTGIYLGNGRIIHSPSQKLGGVRIDDIRGKHLEYRLVLGGGILD